MKTEKGKKMKTKKIKNKTLKRRKGGNIQMFMPVAVGTVAVISSLVPKQNVCYNNKTFGKSGFESLMNNSNAVKKCPPKVKYGRCNTCKKLSHFIDEGTNEKKIKKYEKKCRKCRGNRSTKCNFKEYIKYSGATIGECGSIKGGERSPTKNPKGSFPPTRPKKPLKPQDIDFFLKKKQKRDDAIIEAHRWGYYIDVENPTIPVSNGRIIVYRNEKDEVYALGNKDVYIGKYMKDGTIQNNDKVIENVDIAGLLYDNDNFNKQLDDAGYEHDIDDNALSFGGKKRY